MKKTISILLIAAMLFSLAIAAIPASAAEGASADFDPTTVGNTVVTDANRATHVAGLTGYIPVVNSKRAGETPSNAVLYGEISSNNNYYLWEDITWTEAKFNDTDPIKNIVIDGCGHTITMAAGYFYSKTENITLKNLTITKEAAISVDSSNQNLFGRNGSSGYVKAENLTINVDYEVKGNQYDKLFGVLVSTAGEGSEIKNVRCESDITINNSAKSEEQKLRRIGGLVGSATDATFENVVTEGKIELNTAKLDDTSAVMIAGIVATTSGSVSFKNCVNGMDISIADGSTFKTNVYNIGGIVGWSTGSVTMNNCKNEGDISLNFDNSTTKSWTVENTNVTYSGTAHIETNVGGLVGQATADTNTFKDCSNSGDITLNKTCATALGGVIGHVKGATATLLDNCDNSGDIKLENGAFLSQYSDMGMGLGGVFGISRASGEVTLKNCDNTGNITYCTKKGLNATTTADVSENEKSKQIHSGVCGVGGVMGYQYLQSNQLTTMSKSLTLNSCTNSGELNRDEGTDRDPFLGGVIGGIRLVTTTEVIKCTNSANLTTKASDSGSSTAGGIVGIYGKVVSGTSENPATLDIRGCENTGDIDSAISAGGILGSSNEIDSEHVSATLSGCVNSGEVKVTSKNYAGGIYGRDRFKGALIMEYCINLGDVSSKSRAGGILGATEDTGLKEFSLTNCKNEGKVSCDSDTSPYAGGIAAKVSATNIDLLNSLNTGEVTSTGNNTNAIACGIVGLVTSGANVNGCVNTGAVASANAQKQAPITLNTNQLKAGVANYYLTGCVASGTTVSYGTANSKEELDVMIAAMGFTTVDTIEIKKALEKVDALVQSDYEAAGWAALTAAVNNAKAIAAKGDKTDEEVSAAAKAVEDAIAALVRKALDRSKFDELKAKIEALDATKYTAITYNKVENAVKAVEALINDGVSQSELDAAVADLQSKFDALEEKTTTPQPEQTTASQTQTQTQTEATNATSKKKGCGGLIGSAAVVVTAVLAVGAGISLRKKED